MELIEITVDLIDQLWELQIAYKTEIGEDMPSEADLAVLTAI